VKESYVILIQLSEGQTITIGSLHKCRFSFGYYAYVGSAMGGAKSRLNRHLKENKRPRRHIDSFLYHSLSNTEEPMKVIGLIEGMSWNSSEDKILTESTPCCSIVT